MQVIEFTIWELQCPILKVAPKYFFSEAFSEKMFQTKVVWVEGGHKKGITDLTLGGVMGGSRSDQGHIGFF